MGTKSRALLDDVAMHGHGAPDRVPVLRVDDHRRLNRNVRRPGQDAASHAQQVPT